jgi:two-component system, response regulator FlrC
LQKYAAAYGGRAEAFTAEAMGRLLGYSWPGNIRELENAIQGACIFASEREIEADRIRLDGESAALSASGPTVVDAEKDLILATLRRLNGNRTRAAHALGISVRTVRNRLREYRLTSPELVS